MKCSKIRKKLSAHLDDEVPEPEKQVIAEHLRVCQKCQHELETLSNLCNDLSLVEKMEVPPYFFTRLKQRIADQGKTVPVLKMIRRFALPGFAVVLTLLALALGNTMARTIYQSVAGPESSTETANIFGVYAFNDYPEGSISNIYNELTVGGEK